MTGQTTSFKRTSVPVVEKEKLTLDEPAKRRLAARRAASKFLSIHHHDFFCRDAEETRHFYEDVVGLPMISAPVMVDDVHQTGRYCHVGFELGDGCMLAFFDSPELFKKVPPQAAPNGLYHHLALRVDGVEVLREIQARLNTHGVNCLYLDHGIFHSLYFDDPNGLHLEICTDTPATGEVMYQLELRAGTELNQWTKDKQSAMSSKP